MSNSSMVIPGFNFSPPSVSVSIEKPSPVSGWTLGTFQEFETVFFQSQKLQSSNFKEDSACAQVAAFCTQCYLHFCC